ncbi:hypothetical protein KUCAC02_027238, partial [Chaenocephalus aceratus]
RFAPGLTVGAIKNAVLPVRYAQQRAADFHPFQSESSLFDYLQQRLQSVSMWKGSGNPRSLRERWDLSDTEKVCLCQTYPTHGCRKDSLSAAHTHTPSPSDLCCSKGHDCCGWGTEILLCCILGPFRLGNHGVKPPSGLNKRISPRE